MIDLSAHLGGGTLIGSDARMGGGATMGTLLELLAPQSRLVPVGVALIPGMGLALRGGVGYLTRSAGLTLDHVREVEIVVPSGEVLTLSEQSRDDEADLWWAVRGAGPHFGVVTSVTFRSRPAPPRLFAQRLVLTLEALPAYLELATELPRDISASSALGPPAAGPGAPVLFVYLVCAGHSGAGVSRVQEMTRQLTEAAGTRPPFESADTYSYQDMPPYEIPALDGKVAAAAADPRWGELPATPRTERRLFKYEKCPFLRPLDARAAAGLVDVIRAAPTPSCRIDLQHCGGALGDVAPTATAFWNRSFEWNCPVIGTWIGPDEEREAYTSWAKQTLQVLAPYTVGTYCVEIVPGLPETANEVEQAYGANLPRLRELKEKWDPDNLFRLYYPL
jgi:FAD/FMN-containing dehydrogenase